MELLDAHYKILYLLCLNNDKLENMWKEAEIFKKYKYIRKRRDKLPGINEIQWLKLEINGQF
jgi:hypothetical protein